MGIKKESKLGRPLENPNELNRLQVEKGQLVGISEFLTSPVYEMHIEPTFKAWLSEAEATIDKLSATADELKVAQIKMYYVKQLQRVLLNALTDYERKAKAIIDITGEDAQ